MGQFMAGARRSAGRPDDKLGTQGSLAAMKIVIISNFADSVIRFRGSLLRLLADRGHAVHVLAPDFSDEQRRELTEIGVSLDTYRVERTGQNPLSDLRTLQDLITWLRRERPDVSLTYFIKPNIYGGLAAAIARISRRIAMVEGLGYLFTEDGQDSLKKRLARGLAIALLRGALGRAHRVLFLNPDDRGEFIERGIVKPAQALLLGGIGVDLTHYAVAPLPDHPPLFLMIGRLLREKGVREYVAAARIVRERFPEARFQLIGGMDDNPGGISVDEVQTFTADGSIEWLGELDDVRPRIAACSVYVLPSYREGVPRSTQEAMAMGRPVVTTDVPGCRETVVAGVNGFYVQPRDVSGLAQAMAYFCETPSLIPAMGRESRRIAEEKFDVVKVNERIYRSMTAPLAAENEW